MKILFINNDGGGFADHIEVAENTTAAQLFTAAAARPPARGLPAAGQPAARQQRPGPARGRPRQHDADEDRGRGVGLEVDSVVEGRPRGSAAPGDALSPFRRSHHGPAQAPAAHGQPSAPGLGGQGTLCLSNGAGRPGTPGSASARPGTCPAAWRQSAGAQLLSDRPPVAHQRPSPGQCRPDGGPGSANVPGPVPSRWFRPWPIWLPSCARWKGTLQRSTSTARSGSWVPRPSPSPWNAWTWDRLPFASSGSACTITPIRNALTLSPSIPIRPRPTTA